MNETLGETEASLAAEGVRVYHEGADTHGVAYHNAFNNAHDYLREQGYGTNRSGDLTMKEHLIIRLLVRWHLDRINDKSS